MADLRGKKPEKNIITPSISQYAVQRNTAFAGYKVDLSWEYPTGTNPIVGFKVFKAVLKKPRLERSYEFTQKALEKLTAVKSFATLNTILFNKGLVVQSPKVSLFNSGSTSREPLTTPDTFYDFIEIGFTKANRGQEKYFYTDNKVRFGQTYIYAISAVSKFLFESQKSAACSINIEDIEHPEAPKYCQITQVPKGLMLISNVPEGNDTAFIDIWRRKEDEKQYRKIARQKADNSTIKYIDLDINPGENCFYRLHTVDFFENSSYEGFKVHKLYDERINGNSDVNFPQFELTKTDLGVKIIGFFNDEKVVGYRFERQDVWRFEKGFQIKSYNGKSWLNCFFFDKDGKCEFLDQTTTSGRIYRYRITSILSNGALGSYFVTPNLRIEDGLSFKNLDKLFKCEDCGKTKIQTFGANVLDKKQSPMFVKFSWQINGRWSYVVLQDQAGNKFVIDDLYKDFYTPALKSGKSYIFHIDVYDYLGRLLDTSKEIKINL